jgi:Tfp pilus assembly protein PilV
MALIEALVAATVAGIALLFLVALLAHEARLITRAAGQREALACVEGAIEGLRAGALPLATLTYTTPAPPWVTLPRHGGTLWLVVMPAPTGPPGLWEVTATVRYVAGHDVQMRSVSTMLWQP